MREKPQLIKDDGSFWVPSYQEECPLIGLFDRNRRFYFRRLVQNPKWRFWKIWQPRWVRNGEVYESGVIGPFRVIK